MAYPFTERINDLLMPHKTTLLSMISNEADLDRDGIPVLRFLGSNSKGTDSISISGDVSLDDQARIVNWLFHVVQSTLGKTKGTKQSDLARHREASSILVWLVGTAVLAHAITIFISGAHDNLPLADAFEQQIRRRRDYKVVDIDHECLSLLETRMFRTGDEIWGLDAGGHQDGWDPYAGIRDLHKRDKQSAMVR